MVRAIACCVLSLVVVSIPPAPARADQAMVLQARLAQSVMKAGTAQRNYLRIGLNGCERPPSERTPVNVAFVIDRSGSMQGERIAQARDAAIAAVRRLDKNDIASVIIFDDKIDVLVQAQNVTDYSAFTDRIRQVAARGSTAIYGGVNEGANQVRNQQERPLPQPRGAAVRRPSQCRPKPAGRFREARPRSPAEGISVSTIGLGMQYNEDLMLALARASDGNHTFVGAATDLIQVFNKEFDDVLASCAQTVSIDVELKPGVRVVRAFSRDGKIEGQTAQFTMNQVYAATEHYLLMEVEVDQEAAGRDAGSRPRAGHLHLAAGRRPPHHRDAHPGELQPSDTDVAASRDNTVFESVVEQTRARARRRGGCAPRQGPARGGAQAVQAERDRDREPMPQRRRCRAGSTTSSEQYDGIAATPPAAAAGAWGGQRKMLRQMDMNPAAPGARY